MKDAIVALVRAAILETLDGDKPWLFWDEDDDLSNAQRVDFADQVVTWLVSHTASAKVDSQSEWVWWNKGDGIAVGPRDKGCEAIVFTVEEAQAICRAVNRR